MLRNITCFFIQVAILSACSSPPEVRGVKAVVTKVESTVSSVNTGTVKAERMADLAFGAVGRVSRVEVKFGDVVKKDQILAELENNDLKAGLVDADNSLQRTREAFKRHAVSTERLDEALKLHAFAQDAFNDTLIKAPFDGIITERNIETGQLSQITAVVPRPLLRIVDSSPRYVVAEIDEADLAKVKVGLAARLKILAVRAEPFEGVVRRVVPYISTVREQDRTAQVELDVKSEDVLLPTGASADVELVVSSVDKALAIPTRALLGRNGLHFAFVSDNERIKKTPVKVGTFNYDRAQILSGLSEGDVVVLPSEASELSEASRIKLTILPWP